MRLTDFTPEERTAPVPAPSEETHLHYRVCGRRLCSNVPLLELPHDDFEVNDLVFRYAAPDAGHNDGVPDDDALLKRRATTQGDTLSVYQLAESYLLRWEGLCDFVVSSDGRQITCCPSPTTEYRWVTSTLYGAVLSFALQVMGISNLHASAVVLPPGAIGFLAAPGTGKSSLAAAFAAYGARFLTDDVLALQDHTTSFTAFPAFPFTALSDNSLDGLASLLPPLPATRPAGDKTRVGVDGTWATFCSDPVPLHGLFILNRQASDQPVTVERLPLAEALRELLENTTSLALLPTTHLERHMSFLARLTRVVPVWRLSYPTGLAHARRIRDEVLLVLNQIAA